MGIDGRGFSEKAGRAQCAVYLIGAHLNILFALFPCLLPGIVPGVLRPLQKVYGAHDVRGHEDLRIRDGAIHMGFGSKVDDVIGIIIGNELCHEFLVADIPVDKDVPRVILQILQILQVSGVCQGVQVDDANVGVFVQHIVNEGRSDETRTAGY